MILNNGMSFDTSIYKNYMRSFTRRYFGRIYEKNPDISQNIKKSLYFMVKFAPLSLEGGHNNVVVIRSIND